MPAASLPDDTIADWLDHPFVKMAFAQTDDLVCALERLVEICNEVEFRYPGVPFATVLRAANRPLDSMAIRDQMARAGVEPAWIDEALGQATASNTILRPSRDTVTIEDFKLVAQGCKPAELVSKYGMAPARAARLSMLSRPLTDVEAAVIRTFEERGGNIGQSDLAEILGVTRATVRSAFRKRRYQAWLEGSRAKALTS